MSNKSKLPKAPTTMEVPKVLHVVVNEGIIEPQAKRGTSEQILFKHLHDSMNDRNALDILKGLADAHGFSVEVADEG